METIIANVTDVVMWSARAASSKARQWSSKLRWPEHWAKNKQVPKWSLVELSDILDLQKGKKTRLHLAGDSIHLRSLSWPVACAASRSAASTGATSHPASPR